MKNIQQLREKRAQVSSGLQSMTLKNVKKWNNSLEDKYSAGLAEIQNIDDQISRIEKYNHMAVEKAASGDNADLIDKHVVTQGRHSDESTAIRQFLSEGLLGVKGTALSVMRARQTPDIKAAMSTGTGSEGGYTVAKEFSKQMAQALKAYGGIRSVASSMQTATGAKMNFPTTDATAETGEILGENSVVGLGDTDFSNIDIDVHKYSSKKIAIPFELLQDSMFDIEAYIRELMAMRIGRITSQHFTTGTGTGQPPGIIATTSAGKIGSTGQTTNITYDDLVDLEHSIDPLYRTNAGYMLNDLSLAAARKIKDGMGRPVFVPGYEAGVPGGAPDTLMDRPITISQEMPTMAANAKSVLFGDFSKYVIREVMDLTLFRMADSGFLLNGQIGFVGFNRQGGNLVDVGGAVKYYQNSAT